MTTKEAIDEVKKRRPDSSINQQYCMSQDGGTVHIFFIATPIDAYPWLVPITPMWATADAAWVDAEIRTR